MFRFVFRLLATLILAGAVVMAVLDATRTVANAALTVTPLGESWQASFPASLDWFRDFLLINAPWSWDLFSRSVLVLPGFAVLALAAFLFYAIGRKPEHLRDDWG